MAKLTKFFTNRNLELYLSLSLFQIVDDLGDIFELKVKMMLLMK